MLVCFWVFCLFVCFGFFLKIKITIVRYNSPHLIKYSSIESKNMNIFHFYCNSALYCKTTLLSSLFAININIIIISLTVFCSCKNADPMAAQCARGEVQTAAWCTRHKQPFHPARVQGCGLLVVNTGVRCGCRAGRWHFSPRSLLRRLETVQELIAVPFKRKPARIYTQGLFGERIRYYLIEWSSLGGVFRGRIVKRAISIELDDNIVHRRLGARQVSSNVIVCASFSM